MTIEMMDFVFLLVENIVRKRDNAQGCQILGLCGKEFSTWKLTDFGSTHNRTVMTFDALEEKAFGKHCGKRRKCW